MSNYLSLQRSISFGCPFQEQARVVLSLLGWRVPPASKGNYRFREQALPYHEARHREGEDQEGHEGGPEAPEGEGEHRESRQDRTATTDADGVVAETGGVLITQ